MAGGAELPLSVPAWASSIGGLRPTQTTLLAAVCGMHQFVMSATDKLTPEAVIITLRKHAAELQRAGIRHLGMFGSVSRGEAGPESDIDLVAELDPAARIGLFRLVALERRLAEILGHGVDLVPEPIEQPLLRANVEQDRRRAF